MSTIILLCIIVLGIAVVRFVIGAAVIIVTGKAGGMAKPVGPFLRLWNLVETAAVVYAYVLLVMHFYA